MKSLFRFIWVAAALVVSSGKVSADVTSVPEPCRDALKSVWSEWRLSPPPKGYEDYSRGQQRESSIAKGDFDDDGVQDVAVLLLTSATRRAQQRLAVCLMGGAGAELHIVREPYCGDGISVTPKGTQAWDYERENGVTYRADGVHVSCFEKAGATYVFDGRRFKRVVDSD
jgi:hypothetical protein